MSQSIITLEVHLLSSISDWQSQRRVADAVQYGISLNYRAKEDFLYVAPERNKVWLNSVQRKATHGSASSSPFLDRAKEGKKAKEAS